MTSHCTNPENVWLCMEKFSGEETHLQIKRPRIAI
jgi:hypothetical protein